MRLVSSQVAGSITLTLASSELRTKIGVEIDVAALWAQAGIANAQPTARLKVERLDKLGRAEAKRFTGFTQKKPFTG